MGGQTFSIKGQGISIFGFVDHTVSDTTTQLYHISTKTTIDNMYLNEYDCVPIKCYFKKKNSGLDLTRGP